MFILLKSGAMFNLFWLQDCFQGKHDKKIVIFYTVNGTKLIEEYETEAEALARVNEVHSAMENMSLGGGGKQKPIIVSELPKEDIIPNVSYYVVNTDPTVDDAYIEFIYIDGKWEQQGAAQSEVQAVAALLEWNEY